MSEKDLHKVVCQYIAIQYPNVIYHSDYAAGMKLTIGQAKYRKSIEKLSGWPDIFIAEPKNNYSGLFLELKKDGTRLHKKDGSFANDHIAKQDNVHMILNNKGYKATFAVGFDEAKKVIDEYLK